MSIRVSPPRWQDYRAANQQPSSKRLLTTSTVTQQINEMQMVREKVFAMEQTHLALKQK
jgi:hypothetical protein